MPYIVDRYKRTLKTVTFEDILFNRITDTMADDIRNYKTTNTTKVYYVKEVPARIWNINALLEIRNTLEEFLERNKHFLEDEDMSAHYYSFSLPKRSGGFRRIDAPNDDLKLALTELKGIFENAMNNYTYHTSAYAYVKGRSAVDAVRVHQKNKSRWFLDIDFSNFFGSITKDFLLNTIREIYPFCCLNKELLSGCLDLCMLNGGLPQGTPISPLLTNIIMIPIDSYLCNKLRNKDIEVNGHKYGLVYTRYADDIRISCRVSFDKNEVLNFVKDTIKNFNAPFIINDKKTHYGSSAGRNWNLGVMLNKDNQITIGYRKKKQFKAALHNYITNHDSWDLHDIQVLSGQISYYKSIEKDTIEYIMKCYNEKFSVNLTEMIRKDLVENVKL